MVENIVSIAFIVSDIWFFCRNKNTSISFKCKIVSLIYFLIGYQTFRLNIKCYDNTFIYMGYRKLQILVRTKFRYIFHEWIILTFYLRCETAITHKGQVDYIVNDIYTIKLGHNLLPWKLLLLDCIIDYKGIINGILKIYLL